MRSVVRRTGADPPFSDHRHYHGVPMEGWFWRFTDAAAGTAAIVLAGVCRDGRGATWGMTAVALHPGGVFAEGVAGTAWADPRGPSLRIGELVEADDDHVRVGLPDAAVDVSLDGVVPWPRRTLGGIGPGHLVPWLGQYWHPHALGGRATGTVRVGETTVSLDGASVYAEKNWGRGFPSRGWWWGQAQGFDRDDVCVAFAGGPLGPLHAGALVVRVGDELIHAVRPPMPLRTRGDWHLRARTASAVVDVEVSARDEPLRLPVPVPKDRGVVHGPSSQHLAADLRLHVRRRARTVFEGASGLAGFELGAPS
jgi:tocopherol cyclase